MIKKKPEYYFYHHFMNPHFLWNHYNYGIFIGRIKDAKINVGDDLVWNVYTPWFSFGYAW